MQRMKLSDCALECVMEHATRKDARGLRLLSIRGDSQGRTIWIADTYRGDGKRFVVRADELLTAFVELESAICNHQRLAAAHG
jgi:hypothetical protein